MGGEVAGPPEGLPTLGALVGEEPPLVPQQLTLFGGATRAVEFHACRRFLWRRTYVLDVVRADLWRGVVPVVVVCVRLFR